MAVATYMRFIRKWVWLILLAAFVTGGITFILNSGAAPSYQASVMLSIGSFRNDANPDTAEIAIAQNLVATYLAILETRDVLENSLSAVGYEGFPPEALQGVTRAVPLEGTSLFRITVTHPDPIMAADLANALADNLIAQAPGLSQSEQDRLDNARTELARLQTMRGQLDSQQQELEASLAREVDPDAISLLQQQNAQIMSGQRETSQLINSYTTLIDSLENRRNRLEIVEPARVPTNARTVSALSTAMLGALVGAVIAFGAVIALEYLDDVVRSTEIAVQTLGLPVLGAIARIGKRTDKYNDRLVYNYPSMSPIAEGYRTLRTNLLFSSESSNKGVYIITSPSPEEGKSMTTANLAITMALAGLQVLLVDADLRRPKLHEIFELENNVGLTTLLFADPGSASVVLNGGSDEVQIPENLQQCLQNTSVPRLRVITSGFIPSNPTEILGSALMQRWIDTFLTSSNIDVVLIDTPPCLMVADSSVLAATAKGEVLLVLDASKTRRGAAEKAKERFEQLGLQVKGVILNRLNPRDETYEYTYAYGYYYTPTSKPNQRGKNTATRREQRPTSDVSQTAQSSSED